MICSKEIDHAVEDGKSVLRKKIEEALNKCIILDHSSQSPKILLKDPGDKIGFQTLVELPSGSLQYRRILYISILADHLEEDLKEIIPND